MNDVLSVIKKAKKRLLALHYHANAGHLGGNFSCIDAMIILHHCVMKAGDRFVLSKGHSAGALYVTLWSLGRLSDADLDTFCKENTRLPGHPSCVSLPDILFSTGSLGHGPSLASGLAIAARHRESHDQVYCLCSDGEWQEGSCWEALIFAVHQKLANLTIIIDQNGLQGFGTTNDVISCGDLTERISAFGANVITVDGHNVGAILTAFHNKVAYKPNVVIMNTVKGHGLHFEGALESHYLPLTKEQYDAAELMLNKDDIQ